MDKKALKAKLLEGLTKAKDWAWANKGKIALVVAGLAVGLYLGC